MGAVGCMAAVAGCIGGSDTENGGGLGVGGGQGSGGSETHGGVSVTVAHHVIKTKVLRYDDDDNPCIASVASGKEELSVVLDIDPGDIDVAPNEIISGAVLRCDGDAYELMSVSSLHSDGAAGERLAVGFDVPEDVEPASCDLELTWQGTGSSAETFQFGLGPEQASDLPDHVPSCATVELRASFKVRVRNPAGEDRVLHGVDVITRAGPVEERNGSYQFTVTYSDEGAETVVTRLREFGAFENPGDMTFLIMLDGDVITELGFSAELAGMMERGEWRDDPQLLMMFSERETAERVRNVIVGEDET